MLLQDIARRGWGTNELLMNQSQPNLPSEWLGSASAPSQKAEAEAVGSPLDLFGGTADEGFGDLPQLEPFNFELLPTTEKVDTLGFNTEELTGMSMNEHDPMTATVNLAAVADLLGGPEEQGAEENDGTPMSAVPWEDGVLMQAQEEPQQEWSQGGEGEEEAEMPTVAGLEMYDAEPGMAMGMDPAVAVEMHSEMPTMEAMDVNNFAGSEYSEEGGVEMPTLSMDDVMAMGYGEEQDAVAAQENAVESYMDEVEAPVMEAAPAEPVYNMPSATPGESHSTRSWMSNATTDLSEGALADMAGEVGRSANPVTEMDLAVDGEEVAPFNYDQLDLESDEKHTGRLDTDQIQRTYGTGKLAMPDEEDVPMRSMPLTDLWSEADGDTSLFVTGSGEAGDQGGSASVEVEPEYDSGYLAVESEPTGYMVEQAESYAEIVELYEEPVAVVMESSAAGYGANDVMGDEQPAEEFKVRVARGPWMAYSEAQNRAEAMQPAVETPSVVGTPQYAAGNVAPNVTEYEATGPLHDDRSEDYASASSAANQAGHHTPNFDSGGKLPAHRDILVTGPLPALEGFEDVSDWSTGSSPDMGTQLAMASAYAQSGDFDAALRVYRKLIRRPTTSTTMLRMIGDDLTDIEDVASYLPRYYQVMGDLLLRLGRHREAIEAYNKLK